MDATTDKAQIIIVLRLSDFLLSTDKSEFVAIIASFKEG